MAADWKGLTMTEETKVTINDIAKVAKVSKSTVSRVLSGNAVVAPLKRTAVLKAIEELDYRPNIFAQSLVSGRSFTVGVLTQNIGSPFYDGILVGIHEGFAGSEYCALFADGRWNPNTEQSALQTLLDRRVDGLIVIGGLMSEEKLLKLGDDYQVPLVVVARDLPALDGRCIYVDNFAAAYKVTSYLIEQGHQEIAHITGVVAQQDAMRRREGYLQALADAGIQPDANLIVEGNFRRQSGTLAVEMLMTRGRMFSAIFAANDQMASGARLALYRRGLRVPEDVSIAAIDDEPASAYMTPPLTTMRQPAVEMGVAAAQAILNLLAGKPLRDLQFSMELVVRETVARPI
jgi:LacI family transcriptional regulator